MKESFILLTGATGVLGPYVLQGLLDRGYKVKVATPDKPIGIESNNLFWIETNFLGEVNYEKLMDGVKVVIHLAAELKDVGKMNVVNVETTQKIACSANLAGVELFIYTSSVGVYGFSNEKIITEKSKVLDIEGKFDNSYLAAEMLYEYSITKLKGERVLASNFTSGNIVILRPTNIVRENDIYPILKWPMYKKMWRGNRVTHQIYAGDVAESIIFFLDKNKNKNKNKNTKEFERVNIFNISEDISRNRTYQRIFQIKDKFERKIIASCPFTLPTFCDILKDKIKFRTLSRNLPPGSVLYSPNKILKAGFIYKYTMFKIYEKIFNR
jgi:nucleoside-diphosphate-sugar epimerase